MPAIGKTVVKDKDAQKVYAIEWKDFLSGLTIANSVWTVAGPDSALTSDNPSIDGTQTKLRLAGGTAGSKYTVSNRITLSGNPQQIEERSFYIRVDEL